MNPLERKLRRILKVDRPWYYRLLDNYIDNPIFYDIALSVFLVMLNIYIVANLGAIWDLERDGIVDIINELISSSLSAGGFVLAALAIIASIKMSVPVRFPGDVVESGREYFFNSKWYRNIIRLYTVASIVFVLLFIYFSSLRALQNNFSSAYSLLHWLIFGTSILVITFIRCIGILWSMVSIR